MSGHLMTPDEIARALRKRGVPVRGVGNVHAPTNVVVVGRIGIEPPRTNVMPEPVLQLHQRDGRSLRLVLALPPRTKKNGTTLGIRQTPAYRQYRDGIINAVAPLKLAGVIPLPDVEYNIAAVYYVDRFGKRADLVGLHQGLFDALENGGVVTNDWWFRASDGSRVIPGDAHPRVELTITPL